MALLVLACGEARVIPQVIVRVDADEAVRARITHLRLVAATAPDAPPYDLTNPVSGDLQPLATLPLAPYDLRDPTSLWAVRAEAYDADPAEGASPVSVARASGRYVDASVVEVTIRLESGCDCPEGQTCRDGACVGACVDVRAGDGAPTCSECEVCAAGACVADDTLRCGCEGDSCSSGTCVVGTKVSQISLAVDGSCVSVGSSLYCFGQNDRSQLGLADVDVAVTTPTLVATFGQDIRSLELGGGGEPATAYGCVVLRERDVRCWGLDQNGRLAGVDAPVPTSLGLAVPMENVAPSAAHTCFRSVDRQVSCVGSNRVGQLGNAESARMRTTLEPVGGDEVWSAIASGHEHSCGLIEGGALRCWGFNADGQLGVDGDTQDHDEPVAASLDAGPIRKMALGAFHTCVVDAEGAAYCCGGASFGNLGRLHVGESGPWGRVVLDEPLESLGCGRSHCCGRTHEGALHCWGRNHRGQIGNGEVGANVPIPVPVAEGVAWHAYAGGVAHSCAVRDDGALFCWGANDHGQLGVGDLEDRAVPTRVCLP